VGLLHKFVVPMGERALGLKLALPVELPVAAHLSAELYLVLLHEVVPLLLTVEVLLGLLHSGLLLLLLMVELIRNNGIILGGGVGFGAALMFVIPNLSRDIRVVIKGLFTITFAVVAVCGNLQKTSDTLFFH
jgi:hypothetical protein